MKFYTNVNRFGSVLYVRGYDGESRISETIKYWPDLFLNCKDETGMTDIHGKPVKRVQFQTYGKYKEFKETYENIDNLEVHGDINPAYAFINEAFGTDPDNYDLEKIRVFTIDIETKSDKFPTVAEAKYPINAITLQDIGKQKYYVFGLGEWKQPEMHKDKDITYFEFDCELKLLRKFLEIWKAVDMDVITGWYCRLFDIPYIINRLTKLFGEETPKELSPFGIVNFRSVTFKQGNADAFDIFGISQLDMLDVFKKFGYNIYGEQESYTLDHISHVILGKNKVKFNDTNTMMDIGRGIEHIKPVENPTNDIEKYANKLAIVREEIAKRKSA